MTILSLSDQTKIRAGATRSVLEKTDRILGQSHVRVKIEPSGVPAPAYTDGETITIVSTMDPIQQALEKGFTPKTMMLATALNYHELAHVMFTPRLRSALATRVKNAGMFMSFNILEDQAAETRFVKMFEPARHYFTSLVTNYMMQNQQYLEANYVLVSGRLFLPERFRRSFRDNFSKPEIIDDVDRLVTEYKTLVWPDNETRMFEVIKEFHELINEVNPSNVGTPHDEIKNGAPDSSKAKELNGDEEFVNAEPPPEDEDDEEQGSPIGEEGDEDEGEDSQDASGGDRDEEGEGEEEAGSDGDDDSDESEGKSPNDHDKPSNTPRSKEDLEQDLKDALEEALDEAMHEMEEELDNRIESVKEEESNYTVEQEVTGARMRDPKPEETATVNRCIDEFRQVEMQRAPGWHIQQKSGKLDPKRYVNAMQGSDEIYRRWREGINEMLDFEVVFLLDRSVSMGNHMDPASASLWILKRTFEECDGVVTVLGFSQHMTLLNQRFDHSLPGSVPIYSTQGNTYVSDALKEAKRILSTSLKPLKMCVVISDGAFHDDDYASHEVTTAGFPVAFVGINLDVSRWNGHKNVIHTKTIADPTELVEVIKNLALRLSEERLTSKGLA